MSKDFDYAHNNKNIVWMSQNTNHLPTHDAIQKAIRKTADEREYTKYPLASGLPKLRDLILDDLGLPNHDLHLGVSVRSFRSEQLSNFIGCFLDIDSEKAKEIYLANVSKAYPIVLTRNLEVARDWLRKKSKGTRRCGLVASSGGIRLRPLGINVKAKIDAANWFLNDKRDIRSSFYLEEVATEFDVQGLELDWVGVCWDADLRFDLDSNNWVYKKFSGTRWRDVKQEVTRRYLINAYRVLLTRARQGMVLFIPEGDNRDYTRKSEFYDGTYHYLKSLGISEI